MKFSNIIKGSRAENALIVPGYQTKSGAPFKVLLRPLTGLEHETAYADARKRAVDKGVENPKEGDSIYDLALMAFIVAVGCVDPDSPEEARTPSFESGIEILTHMHPETIVYIHEHHERWQDETSPYTSKMNGAQLLEKIKEVAGPEGYVPFMQCSPSTRVNFATSTARMLLLYLEAKSTPGSSSDSSMDVLKKQQKQTTKQKRKQ